jgi:predicted permease
VSLRRFFRRRRLDRERAAEMRAHLDLATDHHRARGLSPDEAQRAARLRFGNPRAHREGVDDMNRLPLLDMFGRDLRHAWRHVWRAPALSLTAILTLAVTIGAASAVFSLADAVLLKPLALPDPDRLAVVGFQRTSAAGLYRGPSVDGAMWTAVRERASLVDAAVSFRGAQGVNFVVGDTPSFVRNQVVGDGYFRVLGVAPWRGREFSREEARPGGDAVAILSYPFWQRVFAGRDDAIGRTILLRGEPYQVVGVMPSGFSGIVDADVWTPMRGVGQGLNYMVVARLRAGVSLEAANAELATLGEVPFTMLRPLAQGATRTLVLQDLRETLVAAAREPITMLGWAVGAVLLIACVNITALLMARGGTRAKEIATRMALGGGRAAVIRHLMVESLVLAALGGALGVVVAYAGLEGLKALGGATFSEWDAARLDLRAVGATFALAGVTSVLFGLLPAWQTSRIDVLSALHAGGSRTIAGGRRHALRRALVVAQVALGVVVLVAAGLLVRQFVFLQHLDPGFTAANLYSASASLQDARYKDPVAVNRLFASSLERLHRTPGIHAAAVSQGLPYQRLMNFGFGIEGRPDDDRSPPITNVAYVTTGFFDTFDIRIVEGRELNDHDRMDTSRVTVVNEAFARRYFPNEAATGRRLLFGKTPVEIVGVSRDVQQGGSGFFVDGMRRGPISTAPTIYFPAAQTEGGMFASFAPVWTVRASSAGDAAAALSRAIHEADPLLPVSEVRAMEETVARAMAQPRLLTTLVGALALAALLLAAIGIHGLITHSVTERTREFGVRLALGASAGSTILAIARSGVLLTGIGTAIGVALSIPGVTIIESFLYTVQPGDPRTYAWVGALLLAVACISSLLPAMRILRLDPATILRD